MNRFLKDALFLMKRSGAVKWENRELIGVESEVINNLYLFVISKK